MLCPTEKKLHIVSEKIFVIVYLPFNSYLFRTPYFPISALSDFEKYLHEPVFKEMLQIATPDLSKGIDKGNERSQYAAYRYYQRACTRPTPFGLFAGCSVGTFGENTDILLSEQKEYKRITRLDMNYICALTQQIEKDKKIRQQLRYFPNNSMYSVGNNLRYVEYHWRKTRRIHQICQVENSEYINKVMCIAKSGVKFLELAESLVEDEITIEDAYDFIHELIDIQALVSELDPAVTNDRPLSKLINRMKGLQKTESQIINTLYEIEQNLNNIDKQPIGKSIYMYQSVIENINEAKVETEVKYLFQTDMFKSVQNAVVSRNFIKDIQQVLLFINKITPPILENKNLLQFRENFVKRYENREMPLLLVLDNELGIGYADNTSGEISPLIDGLVVPQGKSPLSGADKSFMQSILFQKYQQSSQKIIELTDEDVKGIEPQWNDLPLTFSVTCQLLYEGVNGRSFYLRHASGNSATALLGRFCHLDEKILNHTLAISEKETQLNPDVIFAEIVHLPESRIGNILLRPVIRPYEIPYLAKAGVTDTFELRPDDLYVSVQNNRIRLRSKRLNREIVPRMSTAHNYSMQNSMPVYHFLCDMQHQDKRNGLGFAWSDAFKHFDYLPRVVYKNCILSPAFWTVRKNEIKDFSDIKDDRVLMLKINEWRSGRIIPDCVLLVDGDNELYIDMNHTLSIRAWLSIVKKRPSFLLMEFLFDPTTAVVHGPEGVFTNEFIFAFYKELSQE